MTKFFYRKSGYCNASFNSLRDTCAILIVEQHHLKQILVSYNLTYQTLQHHNNRLMLLIILCVAHMTALCLSGLFSFRLSYNMDQISCRQSEAWLNLALIFSSSDISLLLFEL